MLLIFFSCRVFNIRCICLNVYSSRSLVSNVALWNTLSLMRRQFEEDIWMLVGDFNVILYHSYKLGGNQNLFGGIKSLANFVHFDELMDIDLRGH